MKKHPVRVAFVNDATQNYTAVHLLMVSGNCVYHILSSKENLLFTHTRYFYVSDDSPNNLSSFP